MREGCREYRWEMQGASMRDAGSIDERGVQGAREY
jgi:hypothetical protein